MSKLLSPAILLILLITSCVSQGKFTSLDQERETLQRTLVKTQSELYQSEEDKAQLKMSHRQLIEEFEQLKAELRSRESAMESLKSEIDSKKQIIEMLSKDVAMIGKSTTQP